MKEIICYTSLLSTGETKQLTFFDILFDDRWADGNILCPEEFYSEIGNYNQHLYAKQNYEFLLRASEKYSIKAVGNNICAPPSVNSQSDDFDWEAFRTDCYVVGKYQNVLQENDAFDSIATMLIQQAFQMPWKEEGIAFLEKMISHSSVYYAIDDNTRPILLYYGADVCQNLLNYFIDSLADAFRKNRQRVEIFDGNAEGTKALTQYIDQHFKAIIGMQAPAFSFKMQDQTTFLHDLIHGPKYNMIFDHPAWLKDELALAPHNYSLLHHDRNYMKFCQRYFPDSIECIHLPPAGFVPSSESIPMKKRAYDISFIGTYRDYRERLTVLYTYDRIHRHLAAHYLRIMRRNPDYTGEQALQYALQHFHIQLNDSQFLQLFYDMRQVYFCTLLYYREKVIRTLLNSGITLHVFSDSWASSPFHNHPCLICHPDIDAAESLGIMQNSKISLNIMSWHKDGLTERIFNGMLCQSVMLSDSSTALQEAFTDTQEIVLFSLSNLSALPEQISRLLKDQNKLETIANNGYQKALSHHTWHQRAKQLLDILDN